MKYIQDALQAAKREHEEVRKRQKKLEDEARKHRENIKELKGLLQRSDVENDRSNTLESKGAQSFKEDDQGNERSPSPRDQHPPRDLSVADSYPRTGSIAEKVIYVYEAHIGQAVPKGVVVDAIQQHEPNIKDASIRQTMSRMANRGELVKEVRGADHIFVLPRWGRETADGVVYLEEKFQPPADAQNIQFDFDKQKAATTGEEE